MQDSQGQDYLISQLKISVTVVYDRLEQDITLERLNRIVLDIFKEFEGIDTNLIITSLRNGSLGKYGKTYKLNVQELCIWIREYLKSDEARVSLTFEQKKQFPRNIVRQDKL